MRVHFRFPLFLILSLCCLSDFCSAAESFEIKVIDRATRRGIPMVELTTVDDVVYITDSSGRVALDEPELAGATVFFRVQSPGYQMDRDGFGMEGIRIVIEPGGAKTIEMTRTQPAERLYRVTGRDIYRDTVRLGHPAPVRNPLISGKVVGQDSVQPVIYQDRIYWFWGDTNQLQYPLGLFRTAGAVSELPSNGGLDPSDGINFVYFTGNNGFVRAMVDVPDPQGVVWIQGVCLVEDENRQPRMVGHYSRRKSLTEPLEQGLVIWNDEREIFEVLMVIDLQESWRILRDHPIRVSIDDKDYLCFGNPFPVTRVPATLAAIQNPDMWESLTCRAVEDSMAEPLPESDPSPKNDGPSTADDPLRNDAGELTWGWKKTRPVTQQDEHRWLKAGKISLDEARYLPREIGSAQRVVEMHSGTVRWNEFRRRWIMLAIEYGWGINSPSLLGEVYYAESRSPQGPFTKTAKVATHPKQSFYNPCHHSFFDQDGGRTIWFEGTYCNTFTSSPATPRYNYNQLMYRLDLNAEHVRQAWND